MATIDMLYEQIKLVYEENKLIHKELHELRGALIPEEEFDPAEKEEHERTLSEMASGKEKNWREVAKK